MKKIDILQQLNSEALKKHIDETLISHGYDCLDIEGAYFSGGALSSLIYSYLHKVPAVVNDLDIFIDDGFGENYPKEWFPKDYLEGGPMEEMEYYIEKYGDKERIPLLSMFYGSVYTHETYHYNIVSSLYKDKLNIIFFHSDKEFTRTSLLNSFDLNCVEILYDIKKREFVYKDSFVDFLINKEIDVTEHVDSIGAIGCEDVDVSQTILRAMLKETYFEGSYFNSKAWLQLSFAFLFFNDENIFDYNYLDKEYSFDISPLSYQEDEEVTIIADLTFTEKNHKLFMVNRDLFEPYFYYKEHDKKLVRRSFNDLMKKCEEQGIDVYFFNKLLATVKYFRERSREAYNLEDTGSLHYLDMSEEEVGFNHRQRNLLTTFFGEYRKGYWWDNNCLENLIPFISQFNDGKKNLLLELNDNCGLDRIKQFDKGGHLIDLFDRLKKQHIEDEYVEILKHLGQKKRYSSERNLSWSLESLYSFLAKLEENYSLDDISGIFYILDIFLKDYMFEDRKNSYHSENGYYRQSSYIAWMNSLWFKDNKRRKEAVFLMDKFKEQDVDYVFRFSVYLIDKYLFFEKVYKDNKCRFDESYNFFKNCEDFDLEII